ncbi:MAG TPA: acyclic terpene utilization AtuA family protein [Solirubrobacteraceae bacterium]
MWHNRRPIRVVGFSGYLGDRFDGFHEAMATEGVDVMIGDYLAEITLAALSGRGEGGRPRYVEYFLAQLGPHLRQLAALGRRVVVNAGGFDPAGLADAVRALADDAGVPLRIAHVRGDNLLDRLESLHREGNELRHLDTGAPLSDWGYEPVAANAYLGGWGIAAALDAGADIVICGRVTDASLVLGPAAWWHGWSRTDWNPLAGAVVAGHIIECTAHAIGGNFSGFQDVPGLLHVGLPIAEIAADGSTVITKQADQGGAVTTDTVTAQLVYEIQGPRYLNPDVTVHLDEVRLEQVAADRVAVSGAVGSPPPGTTKVAIFARIGYQAVATVFVTGIDAGEKIDLLRAQLATLFEHSELEDLEITPIGVPAEAPATQWEATIAVRIIATARTREPLEPGNFAARITSLYLSSYPGFYQDTGVPPSRPRPRIDYWPALLANGAVRHEVVLDDGECISIQPPQIAAEVEQPAHPDPTRSDEGLGPTRTAPLGAVAFARSGDKGANSNVGIWAREPHVWPWLRNALTTETLRSLAPELAEIGIVRHEFPHLRAVHFVLRGLLAPAGSSNLRVDQVGKAVGEYLRAKQLEIPVALLDREAVTSAH